MTQENKNEIVKAGQNEAVPQPSYEVAPLSAKQMKTQIQQIQAIMKDCMIDKEHYGTVPGCGDKKVLLKAGAEKLTFVFHMAPRYKISKTDLPGGHREYEVIASLYQKGTDVFLGEGVGSASTMESKYRYRNTARKCPKCHQETIGQSKPEYGGGYYCNQKKGGCGAKFPKGDPSIEEQVTGKVENEDPADCFNTVLKMSKKRALTDATLTATAASDIFTQDLEEDYLEHEDGEEPGNSQPQKKADDKMPQPKKEKPSAEDNTAKLAELVAAAATFNVTPQQLEGAIKKTYKKTSAELTIQEIDQIKAEHFTAKPKE